VKLRGPIEAYDFHRRKFGDGWYMGFSFLSHLSQAFHTEETRVYTVCA